MRKVTYSFFDAGANDYLYRKGYFHCWGVEYEEFESGPGNSTVAIIETPDGNIVTAIPTRVEFEDIEEVLPSTSSDKKAMPKCSCRGCGNPKIVGICDCCGGIVTKHPKLRPQH